MVSERGTEQSYKILNMSRFDTCFFERYARVSLEKLLDKDFAALLNMDRPDLQSADGKTLGIEVTRAMPETKEAADTMLKEMAGIRSVREASDDAEDIDTQQMEHAHQHRGDSADGEQQHGDVHANPGSHALRDIGRTAHSLEEDEVSQSGEGNAAKERHSHQAATGLTEGEHQASYPLHSHTEDEGYSHRHEDGKDNAQRLVCIE